MLQQRSVVCRMLGPQPSGLGIVFMIQVSIRNKARVRVRFRHVVVHKVTDNEVMGSTVFFSRIEH